MPQQGKSSPFPFRPCPAAACVLLLAGEMALASATSATTLAQVTFDDTFLQQPRDTRIDIGRFNRGNAILPGQYKADLYVNEHWIGRRVIVLREASGGTGVQPCIDRTLLDSLGVDLGRLTPAAGTLLEGGACTTLDKLVPDAVATFDSGELRLNVSVPQIAMVRHARGYVDPKYWDEGVTAARLEYNASAYHTDSSGYASTQGYVGLVAGLNVGAWRFRHTGSLTHAERTGSKYQSVQTNLQRSIAPLRSQLVIGEAFTDGNIFDSVGFRGVQMASDDRMYPESQRGYAPVIRGIASSNARVQVRQNGNILYETTVSAGAFEIDDLYPTGYGGDLEVVVTEADGSVRIFKVPYAAAVNALRPGVLRYGVTAGQYRNAGVSATPAMLQGTIQYGFTNLVTGYGGVLMAQGYSSALAGAALNTSFGAFGADVTHATTRMPHSADRSGQSLRLSYSKLVADTGTNLTLAAYRYSTSGYLGLADAVALRDLDKRQLGLAVRGIQRGRLQMTVNQAMLQGYGNFYLSGSTQDYWNHDRRDTEFQIGYNNNFRQLTYGISATRQLNVTTRKWDNRIMLTVGVPLGKDPGAPYATTAVQVGQPGVASVNQSVNGALGIDSAFTYGVNAGYEAGSESSDGASLGVNAAYRSPLATLTANASKSSAYTQVAAGVSGGIVAYSGGVAFTPTMGETLAIVEARDAEGARLTNGSGLRVDGRGRAVVSSLTPFARNELEIDPSGLPLNVAFQSTSQRVAPTSGAVVKVKFDTANAGRTAVIRARRTDGHALPFGAQVLDADGQAVGVVGQGGRVLVHGLKAGSGVLTIASAGSAGAACRITYRLPDAAPSAANAGLSVIDADCVRAPEAEPGARPDPAGPAA